jgi:hypothetical protein
MTAMPLDDNGKPIPALRLKDGGAHTIAAGAAATRNTTPIEAKVVGIYATQPVYIKLGKGDISATSSDHYFPSGFYYDIAMGGATHISVLRHTGDGTVYISEKE